MDITIEVYDELSDGLFRLYEDCLKVHHNGNGVVLQELYKKLPPCCQKRECKEGTKLIDLFYLFYKGEEFLTRKTLEFLVKKNTGKGEVEIVCKMVAMAATMYKKNRKETNFRIFGNSVVVVDDYGHRRISLLY